MRMKIAWLLALIFCATLASVAAGLDLGPIIKTAQCQSTCLRRYMVNGICWAINRTKLSDCHKCWNTCEVLSLLKNEQRNNTCEQYNIHQNCQGCLTACTFHQTRRMEEEEYETTKLPAPEENSTVHMNDYDVAVLMRKNVQGIWEEQSYHYAQHQPAMVPGNWIIVVMDDGAVKHYSWEKWRPKLQFLKAGGPLYQASITWQDWQTQLKNQREQITSRYFKNLLRSRAEKEEQNNPSFVITWQKKTGDGIMGNQVTDSESAQISLSCGKYLVRVATDSGPGSYPIVVDTGFCENHWKSLWGISECLEEALTFHKKMFLLILPATVLVWIIVYSKKCQIRNGKKIEEGCPADAEKGLMKERNLMQENASVNVSVKAQNANASTPNANANVIQKS
ncbi:uncharacterized protein LOC105837055 [Monomorium pharaonis]|uniref:uncharacterized protein LOC105837055 n=1 Tax=Monomorium pharaonis TaxID=307658 RepID=UPI00063F1CC0|nr:uncharacterized protein LOC105837055 [Monomorium pharaonis]